MFCECTQLSQKRIARRRIDTFRFQNDIGSSFGLALGLDFLLFGPAVLEPHRAPHHPLQRRGSRDRADRLQRERHLRRRGDLGGGVLRPLVRALPEIRANMARSSGQI